MEVTNKRIKEWFEENYGHLVEYDGIKITKTDNSARSYPNQKHMKVISFGRVIAQFEGFCEKESRYFADGKSHLDWVFQIK